MSNATIGSVLRKHRGVAPGFDLVRVVLALAIVFWHAPAIVTGDLSPPGRFTALGGYSVLVMFFGLSGFLITASAQRLSLGNFLVNRGLRIVPALAVEIMLCALILGPLFTGLSQGQYFSDPQTYHYFTNIVGLVNYQLPGVFKDHPTDIVNASLWTIPHEIVCYAIMSLFVLAGLLRRPAVVALAALGFSVLGLLAFLVPDGSLPHVLQRIVEIVLLGKGSRLYVGFLCGIAAYLYRDHLPYNLRLFALCAVVVLAAGFGDAFAIKGLPTLPLANLLVLPALIYVTVYLGVSNLWVPTLLKRGDYSYGIYLYGWPIQQTLVALVPFVRDPMLQFLLATPAIVCFAMVSWHWIEKPILGLRRNFSFIARYRLSEGTGAVVPPQGFLAAAPATGAAAFGKSAPCSPGAPD